MVGSFGGAASPGAVSAGDVPAAPLSGSCGTEPGPEVGRVPGAPPLVPGVPPPGGRERVTA